jgi:non-homologous end joining protein Ku
MAQGKWSVDQATLTVPRGSMSLLRNIIAELRDADIDRTYIMQVLQSVIESNGLGDFAAKKLQDEFRTALAEYREEKRKEEEVDDE